MTDTRVLDSLERMMAPTGDATPPPARVDYPLRFLGTGSEYFRIWIVNLLLTIVTLGIFSAWAKVRRLRYFYGNTLLDDHSFEYHARPIAILKGRLIVFAMYLVFVIAMQFHQEWLWFVLPVGVFLMPWILLRSRRFQMRNTSWRNIRFDFQGKYGGALGAFMGWYLIAAAAVGWVFAVGPNPRFVFLIFLGVALAYPFFVHLKFDYSLDNSSYGRQPAGFYTTVMRFYGICLATAILSVGVYFGFFYALAYILFEGGRTFSGQPSFFDLIILSGPLGWTLTAVTLLLGFAIYGLYKGMLVNAIWGGIHVGPNDLRSKVPLTGVIGIHVSNFVALIFTLGIFYPWAKVRLVRYQVESMHLDSDGRLSEFVAHAHSDSNALGQEASDFFDVDMGI